MKTRRAFALAVLLPALVTVVVMGCAKGDGAEGATQDQVGQEQLTPVAAIEASRRDLARTVTVAGPVEPIRTVLVNAQASGTVLSMNVEEGDRVRAGQLLAQLDARETAAQLERARATLTNAEAVYQRNQKLAESGLATDAQLDAARSAYEIAKADVELWRTRLAFSRITAPVAGVITARHVERGGAVSANQTIFQIAEDSELVVRVRVSEMEVVQLAPGQTTRVTLDAYPGVSIPGRIRRIFPSADPTSRLVPVEVVLGPRPRGVHVRPGYLARVEFSIERREGAIAVPALAVGVSDSGPFVYVIQADTLVQRPVQTGITAGGWIEITDGLKAGEQVVSSGHVDLRPGTRVRISVQQPTAEADDR